MSTIVPVDVMAEYDSSLGHLFCYIYIYIYITHVTGHFPFNTVQYFGKVY